MGEAHSKPPLLQINIFISNIACNVVKTGETMKKILNFALLIATLLSLGDFQPAAAVDQSLVDTSPPIEYTSPLELVLADEGNETPTDTSTEAPTEIPTDVPTDLPTDVPTDIPTDILPTDVPTEALIETATPEPTPDAGDANALSGTDRFVSTIGDDQGNTNDCTNSGTPCATISRAISAATAGDTIKVATGTYTATSSIYSYVVYINKNISLTGGWDSSFITQPGISIIDGQDLLGGVFIAYATASLERFTMMRGIYTNGGGLYNRGSTTSLNNVTITKNSATQSGGGIYNYGGTLNLNNVTISDNSAKGSGGGLQLYSGSPGTVFINNTILGDNIAPTNPDCSGAITSNGHNIIKTLIGCTVAPASGDQFNVNPQLGVFLPSEGYHPILSTSPAIDAANPATCLPTDQRGLARVGTCDIGAYEYATPGPATSLSTEGGNGQRSAPYAVFQEPLSVAALDSQGSPVSGISVTVTAPGSGASGAFQDTGTNTTSLVTNAFGIAVSPAFTSNNELGAYVVTASASGVSSAEFSLENKAWFVSPSGNDSNSCNAPVVPCLTINAAISKATGGDTIAVAEGTYYSSSGNEVVLIDKSVSFLGGWDSSFTSRTGNSIINGQNARRGVRVVANIVVKLDHFAIINGNGGIYGGGIYNQGNLTITNSTINHNYASSYGGGIYNFNLYGLYINNVTISGNSAGEGGGIHGQQGIINLQNSIVADNAATTKISPDCNGLISSSGFNIISNTSGCTITANNGDQFDIDAKLGVFLPSAGYQPLLSDSPAIDAGNSATCIPIDQRWVARVGTCDIGSYEYKSSGSVAALSIVSGDTQKSAPLLDFRVPLIIAALDANGSPVPGVEITFTAPINGITGTFQDTHSNTTSSITGGNGLALATTFTANDQLGSYLVTASNGGLSIDFNLENAAWFVSPSGDDNNSCSVPASSCLTINGAIIKADNGDSISVAEGTYTVNSGNEVVLINRNVFLYGGWDSSFTTRTGSSIVDGQNARLGITINAGAFAGLTGFTIQNGSSINGGGIYNKGTLSINESTISGNTATSSGGGILNDGLLTIIETTIDNNTGSGIKSNGIISISNTTVSNNSNVGVINSGSAATIYNTTISHNTGYSAGGILNIGQLDIYNATMDINNATIVDNEAMGAYAHGGGIYNGYHSTVYIKNSIIAQNQSVWSGSDCYNSNVVSTLISNGYNLIGDGTSCQFNSSTGDIVGTNTSPIDPKLAPLSDNGGFTLTHALYGDSLAVNGGSSSTCLPTDQRGVTRPVGRVCDIGAYEMSASITLGNGNPTALSLVDFVVVFNEPVIGVDETDFTLTSNGVSGASVALVNGSGDTYTVTVNTGTWTENATLRLDVVDDDSIVNNSGIPLGGLGVGNGVYSEGPAYTFTTIPIIIAPHRTEADTTPTYSWSNLGSPTQYQYQLFKGTKLIYSKVVASNICNATICSNTPGTNLAYGTYKWSIRSMINGTWNSYSPYTDFSISPAKPGLWLGPAVGFYVSESKPLVTYFTVAIKVTGCGKYLVTRKKGAALDFTTKTFSFSGSYHATGTFTTSSKGNGTLGFSHYFILGCGYISGGPYKWSAKWSDNSQPKLKIAAGQNTFAPFEDGFEEPFTVEIQK